MMQKKKFSDRIHYSSVQLYIFSHLEALHIAHPANQNRYKVLRLTKVCYLPVVQK